MDVFVWSILEGTLISSHKDLKNQAGSDLCDVTKHQSDYKEYLLSFLAYRHAEDILLVDLCVFLLEGGDGSALHRFLFWIVIVTD